MILVATTGWLLSFGMGLAWLHAEARAEHFEGQARSLTFRKDRP